MKKKTAAGTSGGSKKKSGGSFRKDALALMGKMQAQMEAMAGTNPNGKSGPTPGRIFATVKDTRIEDQAGFKNHQEYLLAVMNHGQGKGLDKRLEPLKVKAAGSDEGNTQSNPFGGFLVPIGFVPEPLKIDPEADPIGAATTKIPMGNPIVNINARVDKDHRTSVSGGLVVGRRAETMAATSSRMKFEQVSLEAHSLFGLSFASEELLNDSPVSFAAIIQAGFSDQFTYHLINERLNGTGVGEYMGILNSPCLISVTKETGQRAASLTYKNAIDMRSRCWGYGNAIWIANHDTLPDIMLFNQQVGTGGAVVWQPSGREDHPDMLLGRPIVFTEYAQTLGTVGDLILANWKEYLEGQYQAQQQEESIHVRFVEHERAFKVWVRNAGAPWWKTTLTPRNSTKTLSPFVVVETRA